MHSAIAYSDDKASGLAVLLMRSGDTMAIDAICATSKTPYAAADDAKADQAKAAALLAADKQAKACKDTITKDEAAVTEATAIAKTAEAKIQGETAASRGGVNLVV